MSLNWRKQKILKTIISDYIKRAEPVGSRTLTKRYEFDLSPATIRNEMADLEDMGFLEQPHTSAGRIPTERGYRFFVDELITRCLSVPQQELLLKKLTKFKALEINEIVQVTARALAEMTDYTSLVLGPQTSKSAFQEIQVFPIDQQRVLMVLTTDTGIIESKPVPVSGNLSKQELSNIVQHLNKRLKGLTIDDITPSLLKELRTDLIKEVDLVEKAMHILADSFRHSSANVALGGTKNILNQPEFNDLKKVKELLSFFENEEVLAELLSESEGIVVRIGKENPRDEVKDCSLVTASYELNGRPLGTIGVLGPTRMDYSRVIAIVAQIANELTMALDKKKITEE
ncbi:heat-inducible transcriptional repressor HrcA [Natranaerobius thermophilus]|uniref:Heat-inducible transcription repressor HrcA n=1 Tax=Natranaerobius thermophilus (strain ATCC BAA-1301 / DSM 18059 / JW/NM-WN-LF) TaxID=457570 RepID=HRCA_NATTJ|nr:heat-inducible transcriptional repressor HrcA [Natranaerobius thermophilus]B2A1M7.1 RecName: Full=Heat-inducible transcription repressor HrcA [Natranaerobius thermophilus JW/NM-WN-LF]ACB84764.1 heat-inducible transcription repressor HrcA [Natranaerobius thermophilus JW/NM-WN-LF]